MARTKRMMADDGSKAIGVCCCNAMFETAAEADAHESIHESLRNLAFTGFISAGRDCADLRTEFPGECWESEVPIPGRIYPGGEQYGEVWIEHRPDGQWYSLFGRTDVLGALAECERFAFRECY